MLQAFVEYEKRDPAMTTHAITGMPLGTRLLRIVRKSNGWWLWTATNDYVYGTLLILYENGRIDRITTRIDEGDELVAVRPSDEEIRQHDRKA